MKRIKTGRARRLFRTPQLQQAFQLHQALKRWQTKLVLEVKLLPAVFASSVALTTKSVVAVLAISDWPNAPHHNVLKRIHLAFMDANNSEVVI